ncbi:hypothetical protein AB4Y89_12765 [Terriglobus sp. 2YAB30_2]
MAVFLLRWFCGLLQLWHASSEGKQRESDSVESPVGVVQSFDILWAFSAMKTPLHALPGYTATGSSVLSLKSLP